MPPQIDNQNKNSDKFLKWAKYLILILIISFTFCVSILYVIKYIKANQLKMVTEQSRALQGLPTDVKIPVYNDIDVSDWKTYKDEENNFELKYPNNWYLNSNGFISNYENINSSSIDNLPIDLKYINISVKKNEKKLSLDLIGPNKEDSFLKIISSSKFITRSGIEGRRITFYSSDHPVGEHRYAFFINRNGDIITIGLGKQNEDVEDIFNKIISTFNFNPNWDTENVGNFTGYYIKTENNYGEEGIGPYTCDDFIPVVKDNTISKWFKESMDWDMKSIGIEINNISTTSRNKILRSSKNNPVTLVLQKKVQYGKGKHPCASFFKILDVK